MSLLNSVGGGEGRGKRGCVGSWVAWVKFWRGWHGSIKFWRGSKKMEWVAWVQILAWVAWVDTILAWVKKRREWRGWRGSEVFY